MEVYKEERRSRLLRIYLKLSIVFGILAILFLFRIYLVPLLGPILYKIVGIILFLVSVSFLGYTLLSIYVLVDFLRKRFSTITLIVPAIEVLTSVLGIASLLSGFGKNLTFYIDICTAAFIICLSFYILQKLK